MVYFIFTCVYIGNILVSNYFHMQLIVVQTVICTINA